MDVGVRRASTGEGVRDALGEGTPWRGCSFLPCVGARWSFGFQRVGLTTWTGAFGAGTIASRVGAWGDAVEGRERRGLLPTLRGDALELRLWFVASAALEGPSVSQRSQLATGTKQLPSADEQGTCS